MATKTYSRVSNIFYWIVVGIIVFAVLYFVGNVLQEGLPIRAK